MRYEFVDIFGLYWLIAKYNNNIFQFLAFLCSFCQIFDRIGASECWKRSTRKEFVVWEALIKTQKQFLNRKRPKLRLKLTNCVSTFLCIFCCFMQVVFSFWGFSWVRGFKTFKEERSSYIVDLFDEKESVFCFKNTSDRFQMRQKTDELFHRYVIFVNFLNFSWMKF